jgi:hypothetical protein
MALFAPLLAALAMQSAPVAKKDFIISVSVVPGGYLVDMDKDLEQISKIANTMFLPGGAYKSFQTSKLKPLLDAAHKKGLKVVLLYYHPEGGNTTIDSFAKDYGNHPAVIGFKVQDELGSRGDSVEFFINHLKTMRKAIRKYTDKPIMVDVIPFQFWNDSEANRKKWPAATNAAIDRYIDEGLIDWLIVSMGRNVETVMPKVAKRWGKKIPIMVRTSAGYKGDDYSKSSFTEAQMATAVPYSRIAYENGAIGITYYAWQHGPYKIMDPGLKPNKAFNDMVKNFQWFQK